ncbi:MAG: hypothetical protein R3D55_25550, partial [Chloroflexota bacterium]
AANTGNPLGTYYTIAGEDGVHVQGGRPVQPRTSASVSQAGRVAHGVLMTGGTFNEIPNFNPVISQLITEEVAFAAQPEPLFLLDYWYPVALGSINRYLSIDGASVDRLVIVPGQFEATGTGAGGQTIGTQRNYTDLQFEVYHTPFDNEDFIAPSIWNVEANRTASQTVFRVDVSDNSTVLHRVVVLYRELPSNTWQLAEMTYNAETGTAVGTVFIDMDTEIEFFAQAVDGSGNVSVALSHGSAYFASRAEPAEIFIPVILKP